MYMASETCRAGKCNKVTLNNLHRAGLNKTIYLSEFGKFVISNFRMDTETTLTTLKMEASRETRADLKTEIAQSLEMLSPVYESAGCKVQNDWCLHSCGLFLSMCHSDSCLD